VRPSDTQGKRRATADDVARILFAEPETPWTEPSDALDGVEYRLESTVDVRWAAEQMRARSAPSLPHRPQAGVSQVLDCPPYRKIAWGASSKSKDAGVSASEILTHADLGAVYVDRASTCYLHFGANQIPTLELPNAKEFARVEWNVTHGAGGAIDGQGVVVVTVAGRGPLRVDWVVHCARSERLRPFAARVLDVILGDTAFLESARFPRAEIARHGFPLRAETWLVDAKGARTRLLSRHSVRDVRRTRAGGDAFRIPAGFRDMRAARRARKKDGPCWYPVPVPPGAGRRARDGTRTMWREPGARTRDIARVAWRHAPAYASPTGSRPSASGAGTSGAGRASGAAAVQGATAHAATFGTGMVGRFVPPIIPPREPDIELDECLPSTLETIAGYEARQTLFTHIQYIANLATARLNAFTATRDDPTDPENTDVTLTVDWLAQLAAFHDANIAAGGTGDGVFCFLRDPPPADDPTAGGTGILDRIAEAEAARLVNVREPLPFGGEDDPIDIPQEVAGEIEAIAADDTITRGERYRSLSATSQAALREAVLAARIASFTHTFNGDSGEMQWPEDHDLVRVRIQLESATIDFQTTPIVNTLAIHADDDGSRPRVDVVLRIPSLVLTLSMDRWPGVDFWITAGVVIVAGAVVGPAAVTALIVTLMAMGPLGLLILAGLVSSIPTLIVIGVVLLAVVIFLIWDAASIRVTLVNVDITTNVHPDIRDFETAVADVDTARLDGAITVEYSSEIPTGVHQLLGWLTAGAINIWDLARDTLEDVTANRLENALDDLPQFRSPLPFDAEVDVPVSLPGGAGTFPIGTQILRHQLFGFLADGSDDATPPVIGSNRITVITGSRMVLSPREAGLYLTQTDEDTRDQLRSFIDAVDKGGDTPYMGYALSQNLLNGYVQALWIDQRFSAAFNDDDVRTVFDALAEACSDCAPSTDAREVHVWSASSPRVLLTPRLSDADPSHPYLEAFFDDLRLCIAAGKKKDRATLEIQFAARALAHVGFGQRIGGHAQLSLFARSGTYASVFFDTRDGRWSLTNENEQAWSPSAKGSPR
jgi:hypothetical protein